MRVGFLGAGLIATFHSKMIRRSGVAVERAGVYDPDAERAARFAAASGSVVCASEDEVLDGCDAVYVCTWTSEHPRLVAAAVGAGAGRVLREAARDHARRGRGDGRRGHRVRRHEPGRADPPAVPGVRLGPPPRRGARGRAGDGRRLPGRPVHPDAGHLRLDLARRPVQGRRGHAARALDPRRRHAPVPGRRRDVGVGTRRPLPRARRHRGRHGRVHGVRGRRRPAR